MEYWSIEQNIQENIESELNIDELPKANMMPFSGSAHTNIHTALPFTKTDYFHLVDTTGRVFREGKKGFIPSHYPPILQGLGVDQKTWLQNVTHVEKRFGRAAGQADKVIEYAKRLKIEGNSGKWCKSIYSMTNC